MKYSYFARQPIIDINKKTIGYELLFRDGHKNCFPNIDTNLATIKLLSENILTTQNDMLEGLLGFVNFPYQSIIDDIPFLFQPKTFIIEILEDCQPTNELLEKVKKLSKHGYTLALDDFTPKKEWLVFLPYIDIIKFDIRIFPIDKAQNLISQMNGSKIKFLAEKVETFAEFEAAKEAGFSYFQGYFFSKPEVIKRKTLESSTFSIIQLLSEISKLELDIDAIEKIISRDVTLSYKLLRFVNSLISLTREIQSFRQALVYLGEKSLRGFISLVIVTSTPDDKPQALYSLSIQRAKFFEILAPKIDSKLQSNHAFLTGILSLLDCLLDKPLAIIISEIPIDFVIKMALLEREGILGSLLKLVSAIEHVQWQEVDTMRRKLNLSDNDIFEAYNKAISWTNSVMSTVKVGSS